MSQPVGPVARNFIIWQAEFDIYSGLKDNEKKGFERLAVAIRDNLSLQRLEPGSYKRFLLPCT
jgi:hypothetical protein